MTSYKKIENNRDVLKKELKDLPIDLIDLICDFANDNSNICKNIFLNALINYEKGSINEYCIKYHNGDDYDGINLPDIVIKAHSNEEASLIWMDYYDKHMKTLQNESDRILNREYEHYQAEFYIMLEIYDNVDINCKELTDYYNSIFDPQPNLKANDKTFQKLLNKFLKDGLPKEIFDTYFENEFENDVLWFEKKNKPIILTM